MDAELAVRLGGRGKGGVALALRSVALVLRGVALVLRSVTLALRSVALVDHAKKHRAKLVGVVRVVGNGSGDLAGHDALNLYALRNRASETSRFRHIPCVDSLKHHRELASSRRGSSMRGVPRA